MRGGIETVLIPHENNRELAEIPKNIKQNLDIRPVRWIDEVLEVALEEMPKPAVKKRAKSDIVKGEDARGNEKNDSIRPH